jgi:hypothetical protein
MPGARRLLLVLVAATLLFAPLAHAKRPKPIKLHMRFMVPPGDTEVCEFIPVPMGAVFDSGGVTIRNVGVRKDFVSHHFLLYSYTGSDAAAFPKAGTVVPDKACLNFGPSDRNSRLLIGGSQGLTSIAYIPKGLAQQIHPTTGADGEPALALILNSHWINGSTKTRRAAVNVKIVPAKPHTVKRYIEPIFDVFANGTIYVAPGTAQSTLKTVDFGALSWLGWGPGGPDPLAGFLGSPPMPSGPACVTMVTAHMHKRGKLFSVDYVPANGPRQDGIYTADDYTDPGQHTFDPPLLLSPGDKLQYSCLHDNGKTTVVKLGCEEKAGVIPGGIPFIGGHTAKRCDHAGANPDECPPTDPAFPNTTFTGNCVPANLVFGFTSDDDMCILPGTYYPADPVHGCDLGPLPVIN